MPPNVNTPPAACRVVADEPRGDRGDADLGLGEPAAAFVAAEVRVVHAGQHDADDAGDGRMGDHVHLARGWPPMSMPSRQCTSCGITCSSVLDSSDKSGSGRGGIVGLARRAENRGLRLQGIDLVERPQQREDDVAVVDGIGDGRRKRLPKRRHKFVIPRHHSRTPPEPRMLVLSSATSCAARDAAGRDCLLGPSDSRRPALRPSSRWNLPVNGMATIAVEVEFVLVVVSSFTGASR